MVPARPSLSPSEAARLVAPQRKRMKVKEVKSPNANLFWGKAGPIWSEGKLKAKQATLPAVSVRAANPVVETIRDLPMVGLEGVVEIIQNPKILVLSLIIASLVLVYRK